ncbi:Uncharacterised protein [Mycobacteroides abscessus subsp. abscessus]|nr:Uncharacterised protein [Mycobacteroides abscessus subsp. abscessus]
MVRQLPQIPFLARCGGIPLIRAHRRQQRLDGVRGACEVLGTRAAHRCPVFFARAHQRYTMTVVVPCATSLPCESTTLPSAVATRRPGCNTVPVATKRSPSTGTVRT